MFWFTKAKNESALDQFLLEYFAQSVGVTWILEIELLDMSEGLHWSLDSEFIFDGFPSTPLCRARDTGKSVYTKHLN